MGGLLKTGQRVALKFEGNGPMQKMIIEAESDGSLRASCGNPTADAEPVDGSWNVPGGGESDGVVGPNKVYWTSMATLVLDVYMHFLPAYQR